MGAYADGTKVEPLAVHVSNLADIKPPKTLRKRYKTVYETIVLTAGDPVQDLLPASDERECAYVAALDFDVVIGKDLGTTQAGRNTAQSPATPIQPSGFLLSAALRAPWPIYESGKLFVAATNLAAANGSRVALTVVYCDGYV
jgi:hypothetical protein